MGQLNTTDPAPPWAVTMWMTDHDIICLLPMTAGGTPYMMKFPRNEGGLSQALQLLRKQREEVLTPTEAKAAFEPPKHQPQVRLSPRREAFLKDTTEEQRENARKLLERLGLGKPR